MPSAIQYFVDKVFLFSAILTMAYFRTLSGVGVKSNNICANYMSIVALYLTNPNFYIILNNNGF